MTSREDYTNADSVGVDPVGFRDQVSVCQSYNYIQVAICWLIDTSNVCPLSIDGCIEDLEISSFVKYIDYYDYLRATCNGYL